jgi:hypothetical protein
MQVLVFKTGLTDVNRINDIKPDLDAHPDIYQWNVDRHDRDNILRIAGNNIVAAEVEKIVLSAGYYCEELE